MDFREMFYQQQFAEAEKDMKRKRREVEQAKNALQNLTGFLNGFMRTTSTEPSAMNGF